MSFQRGSATVSFANLLVLLGVSVTAPNACSGCRRVLDGGTWLGDDCGSCVDERPYSYPSPPPPPPPRSCATDASPGNRPADECSSDLECRGEARCARKPDGTGICKRACAEDDDCSAAFVCVEGLCVAPETPVACGAGGSCPAGLVCFPDGTKCVPRCTGPHGGPEPTCSPPSECSALGACYVVDFGSCLKDVDCRTSEGAACNGGRCGQGLCDTNADAGFDGS